MSRIGFFCFPAVGHLNPAIALGHHLEMRGHQVTFFHPAFHRAVAEPAVLAAGLRLHSLPESDVSYHKWRKRAWGIGGKLMEAVEGIERNALRVFSAAPRALASAHIDAIIGDQVNTAAGTVAEYLDLPFITLGTFPPVYLQEFVPPANFGWRYRAGPAGRLRNRIGNAAVNYLAAPLFEIVNRQRRAWNLPELTHLNQLSSKVAIITPLPRAFDFPCPNWPSHLFHTGPFRDDRIRQPVQFPWEQLDGKPLIYASMGTVVNDRLDVFRIIEEACHGLDIQLVLSLGAGGLNPDDLHTERSNTIVRHYVPQLGLLRHAHLTITHAGLNTTLESLAEGVPLVAMPVSADQPGVAARIEWAGCGTVVPMRKLSVRRLRNAVTAVLANPKYRAAARRLQKEITRIDGLECAANIVERVIQKGTKALCSDTESNSNSECTS